MERVTEEEAKILLDQPIQPLIWGDTPKCNLILDKITMLAFEVEERKRLANSARQDGAA